MTDNEIVKALECCPYQRDCVSCDLDSCNNNPNYIMKCARDLINRQKAEIESLQKIVNNDFIVPARGSCKTHLVRMKRDVIKTEAIKEFAMRFETELGEQYMAKHLVIGTVLDKVRKEMVGDVG